jgi:hypothetical protein
MIAWVGQFYNKAWCRWWAARILATTICSSWLHAGNPEFTRMQLLARNCLRLAIFLTPEKLPLSITLTRKDP